MTQCTCNTLINNQRQYDPTRTTSLRNAFAREMRRRFNALSSVITKAIVVEDCFGLMNVNLSTPGHRAFDFPRNADKITAFLEWLHEQVQDGVLEVTSIRQVGSGVEAAWTNIYIKDSYKRGIMRARTEMRKAGFDVPLIRDDLELENWITQPFHADRLGLLFTRTFTDLKGITDAMEGQIGRVLAQGMADGDSPTLIARKLNAVIKEGGADLGITDTIGRYIPARRRAQILARTEIIRAHHQATIQEYKNWGVEGVVVQAEFRTAGDARVCEICQGMEGNVYGLNEAMNIIPVHPQCRCIMLPFKVKDQTQAITV